ncbi:Uncharacterised protein [Mycobacteroides abscessus subsp. abscessus]|uniref:hypothetical protein n=1 Tax=Mycobacteroides abscessus TaxID=36809 RepID=UPI00092858D3|nr:hypothetical protein [Mycobacteroides abscessus]SHX74652.1 Uncharacterised protein [Mycobacteroides abscessus subsp. abscessus]SHY24058.1 Uncharacterised protein [Mycobacteroides abscessus subsp. abscessus]SIC28526.1 Uncharacterised protein [Mycobacteroides abscessus subsp. abscessus]SKT29361.1 Uncharacterised protein [Mycobacteroides abscessus subsp. bolletii]SKV40244.1 Uncharacterised protein [Mycobacteroides abscessus subsp. abscessus]
MDDSQVQPARRPSNTLIDRLLDKLIDRVLDRVFARIGELDDKLPVIADAVTRAILDRTGLNKLDELAKTIVTELLSRLRGLPSIPFKSLFPNLGDSDGRTP